MELTSKYIKEEAIKAGAAVCGIGSLDIFEGEDKIDEVMVNDRRKNIVWRYRNEKNRKQCN